MPDLVVGGRAQGDINGATRLLQNEKDRGSFRLGDRSLPTYLYCFNAYVAKAEVLAARNTTAINKDSFVDWLRRNCRASSDFIRQSTTNEY
jgi:hypothetical protein